MVIARPSINLTHITGWVFDLDNTLYPASSGLFLQVAMRMNEYLQNTFKISPAEAIAMRRNLFERFGTTGRGLMEEHHIDPADFLSYVHNIDLSAIVYDAELDKALGKLAGKKVIFTNGTTTHANRILEAYRIKHHFEYCYDIIKANHRPKPEPIIYHDMLMQTGINPNKAVMIEDIAINLKPAANLGMTTVWLDDKLGEGAKTATDDHINYTARDLKSFLRMLAAG